MATSAVLQNILNARARLGASSYPAQAPPAALGQQGGLYDQAQSAGDDLGIPRGYGYYDPYVSLAGIVGNYRLGQGGLAQGLGQDEFSRQMQLAQLAQNPFNIVSALDMYARTGARNPVSNPVLENIEPWMPTLPGSRYTDFADSLLGMPDAATRRVIEDAYARDPAGAEDFFRRASGGGAMPLGAMSLNQVGAQGFPTDSSLRTGMGAGATSRATGSFPLLARPGQSALSGATRLLGSSINTRFDDPTFKSTLGSGRVPGFGTFRDDEFDAMTEDQQDAYLATVQGTGNVSDSRRAYANYRNRMQHGSAGLGGGVYR
jgi:hypothetical protein